MKKGFSYNLQRSCREPIVPSIAHRRIVRLWVYLCCFVTALCCHIMGAEVLLASENSNLATGFWTSMASAPTARTEVAAGAIGTKIFVIGGFSEPAFGNMSELSITTRVDAYDTRTDQWTARTPLPIGLHHVGIGVVGDRIYVIGGFTQSLMSVWKPVATVYIYDPARDAWTEGASMPTARGALAVAEVDGKLFAVGGYDGTDNTAAVEVYDPTHDSWEKRAPLPIPRDHLTAATVKGRLYAIGGRLNRDYRRNLSAVHAYDPSTDRWTRVSDLPTARSGITSGVLNDQVYVLGGESTEGTFATNEVYAPGQDRWATAAPMPTARHGLGSAVVAGHLYVLSGGPSPGGSFSRVNEMFTPPVTLPSTRQRSSRRATSQQVGAVMALLATFEQADVLPPESSPDANRLIKALIQFQAAFMKSDHPTIVHLLSETFTRRFPERATMELNRLRAHGWTSESLEALVDSLDTNDVWQQPSLQAAFRTYNVSTEDFALLSRIFHAARGHFADQGQNLHTVYSARRREMPGAGS